MPSKCASPGRCTPMDVRPGPMGSQRPWVNTWTRTTESLFPLRTSTARKGFPLPSHSASADHTEGDGESPLEGLRPRSSKSDLPRGLARPLHVTTWSVDDRDPAVCNSHHVIGDFDLPQFLLSSLLSTWYRRNSQVPPVFFKSLTM